MKKKFILLTCISIFITQIFAVDIYFNTPKYDKYLETVADFESKKKKYDETKINSENFLNQIRNKKELDDEIENCQVVMMTINEPRYNIADSKISFIIWKLKLNKYEEEYLRYKILLKQESIAKNDIDVNYISFIEKSIYEKLSECNSEEVSFFLNPKVRGERKYPNIELNFGSMASDQTPLEYVINYTEDKSKTFKGLFNKNIYNEKSQENISYVSDFCVRIINSVLPYINEESLNKIYATKNDDAFLIDTIYVRKYLGREVVELPNIETAGMDVIVNNDNSFYLKSDDKLRLYDANGNIKFDFTQTLIDIGIDKADHRNLFIKEIDSKLYVFKLRDYLNAYVFDGTKYLGKKRFYCSNANSLAFERYVSAVGYPAFSKYDDRSLMLAGTEIGSEKVYDFMKIYRTSSIKILKNGDFVFLSGNLLTICDEKGNVKKCITLDIADTQTNAISYINDEILVIIDNEENCYLVFSPEGEFLYSIPSSILTASEFVAYKNGIFYFTSYWSGGNRLCRVGGKNFSGPDYLKEISKVNKHIAANPYNHKLYKQLYKLYLENDGTYLAYSALSKYLEFSPIDSKANEQKLKLELSLQKKAIAEEVQNVIKVYDELGEISATSDFLTVATKIEKLLKQFPNDDILKSQYAELLGMFGKTSTAIQNNTDDLSVEEIDLVALFPALKNVYATNPCGTIKLKNISGKPITNITVSSKIRKYMDYDAVSEPVEKLESDENCVINLLVPINDAALSIQENSNLQIQYTINWECDGRKNKMNVTRPITIYKKSAMCWNDARMLSCFILPNNSTVSDFSLSVLSNKDKNFVINKNINIVATLVDGMGIIPLTYVADPDISFSTIVNNEYAVDTVRFPNETLRVKGGDCDDMTTLFCSVLESVGISTAIITIPGHIMAAFDSGEKSNAVWEKLNEDGELVTLNYNGKIFIPIETTVMGKGFMECWKSASKQLSGDTEIEEFVVINEQRDIYPPIAIDDDQERIQIDHNKLINQKQIDKINAEEKITTVLLKMIDSVTNVSVLNTIAKMYHLMGKDEQAIEVLLRAISMDGTYSPSYKNLANLYIVQGNTDLYEKLMHSIPKGKNELKQNLMSESDARAAEIEDIWYE